MRKGEGTEGKRGAITRRSFLVGAIAVAAVPEEAEGSGLIIKDDDLRLRGNAEFISENDISVGHENVVVGDNSYRLTICEKKGTKKFAYLVLHDSEDAAFDAALRGIQNGGIVVKINNNGMRDMPALNAQKKPFRFDPNRIFDKNHSEWLLAHRMIVRLKERLDPDGVVLSMHNSNPVGRFNLAHLLKERKKEFKELTDPLPDKDPYNMIIITGPDPEPPDAVRKEAEAYAKLGCNAVYECANAPAAHNQGSFSVYAAKEGIKSRTVETRRGVRGSEKEALKTAEKYRNAVISYHSAVK